MQLIATNIREYLLAIFHIIGNVVPYETCPYFIWIQIVNIIMNYFLDCKVEI
jgi:hypothetical protein